MAHLNETENYHLSQFLATDKPAWLTDYNTDMEKIDGALGDIQTQVTENHESETSGIEGLDERMTTAEQDIDNLEDRATSLETRMTNAEGRLDVDEANITSNTNRVGVLETKVTDLENGQGLANDSITTDMLKDHCVTTDKLAYNSVTTDEILNGTIQYEDLSQDCINHFDPTSSAGTQILKNIVNALFPIGSLYMSIGVNPNTKFPGTTWVRQTGGVLYMGANSAEEGTSTGSDTVTLTTSNLPRHRHSVTPTGSVSSTASTSGSGSVNTSDVSWNQMTAGATGGSGTEVVLMPSVSGGAYSSLFNHHHSVNLSGLSINVTSTLSLDTVYTDYQYAQTPTAVNIKQLGMKIGVWKRTA